MSEDTKKPEDLPYVGRVILTSSCVALAAAIAGFGAGISYGKWLSEPISVMEQNLNEDQVPDLSTIDRELDRKDWLGTGGGNYRKRE